MRSHRKALLGFLSLVVMLVGLPGPAQAAGCKPVCTVSGVLSGSGLSVPDYANEFTWSMNFTGGYVRSDTATAGFPGPTAYLQGRVTARNAARVSAHGTLLISQQTTLRQWFAAIPVRIEAVDTQQDDPPTFDSGSVELLAPLDQNGVGVGTGSTIAFHDGSLEGLVHFVAASEENIATNISMYTEELFVRYDPWIEVSGLVSAWNGQPLHGIEVEVSVDGVVTQTTTTDEDGYWTTDLRLDPDGGAQAVDATILGATPFEDRAGEILVYPGENLSLSVSGPGRLSTAYGVCFDSCSLLVRANEYVDIQAIADNGATFTGFFGDCYTPLSSCSVYMDYPKWVGGSFSNSGSLGEQEPNNSLATANTVPFPSMLHAAINPLGDVDYFKFTQPIGARTLVIETFDGSEVTCPTIDTTVTLFNSSGSQIGFDDDGGPRYCSSLVTTNLPAGTYTVAVAAYNNNSTISDYTLRLTERY
jgi:hypothetical protein